MALTRLSNNHSGMHISRSFRRFLALGLLALLGLSLSGWAMQGIPKNSSADRPLRLLVKFRTPPMRGSTTLASFLTRHRLRKIEPLYSDWMARKERTGKSALELSQDIQKQFPDRARRFKG